MWRVMDMLCITVMVSWAYTYDRTSFYTLNVQFTAHQLYLKRAFQKMASHKYLDLLLLLKNWKI